MQPTRPSCRGQGSWLQARLEYYAAYAQLLASWGFVVLQYNLPLFRIVKDAAEVCFLMHACL